MSEQGKGSLLLPLGIGAGLLLLLTSMKKKDAATPAATAAADDTAASPPDVTAATSSAAQIDPAPAPSYSQAVSMTTGSEKDEEPGGGEDEGADAEDSQEEEGRLPGEDDDDSSGQDEDERDDTPSYASKSSGGSYTPYTPTSSINTNRQTTPLPAPAYTQPANPASIINRRTIPANKSMRFQSDQAKKAALQKSRNNKGMQAFSDQAKKFAARSGAASNTPLFIGKGKPRMGVRLPVTQRPGATAVTATTTATMPVLNVTAQPAATPAAQATIFPLKFGTTSSYVKEVQRKLGVSATGYFGTMTRTAIQKRFKVSEISEALYKQIITGKTPAPPMLVRKPVVKTAVKKVVKPVQKIKKPVPKKLKPVRRK